MVNNEPIKKLDIATGGTCNLKCSYCFLHDLASQKTLDKTIQESLKSGDYAKTCAKVLKTYDNSPLYIENISCWGGESTLHLPLVKEGLHFWKETFPNLQSFEFITNGSYKAQDMFEIACEMDRLNFDYLQIQTSLDGPQEVTNARGISVQKIINTLCELTDLLNTVKFKNLKVRLTFKSTAWVNVYNEIHKTIESATKYYKFWADNVIATIESHRNNLNLGSLIVVSPLDIAYQFDYSQQDGIDFAHSLRVYNSLDWNDISKNIPKHYPPFQSMVNYFEHFTHYQENSINLPSHNYYCGSYVHGLFIRPDGAVLGCLGSLFIDDENFISQLKEKDPLEYETFKNIPLKDYIFKPLELDKTKQTNFINHKATFINYAYLIAQSGASMIYELALAGQVDSSYKVDMDKLVRHSYLMADKGSCWFNNLKQTGSAYIALPGVYRLLCNGALDYFDFMEHTSFLQTIKNK